MKTIVFTLDYELYGNGSGDVFEHMIRPTARLLDIADEYGVKYTIFFEFVEYLKLKEEWDKGNAMGYVDNPVEAIENQIRDACRRGHDIQLHIHPQWVDAQFVDGRWCVDMSSWRLGGYDRSGKYSLENILRMGKHTVESLLRPVDPSYECIALRAGGYNIQPSAEIVKAMKHVGLHIDSSIYPGGRETGSLSRYDYTGISPECGLWQVGDELEKEGMEPVYELPIVAFSIRRWRKYCSVDRIKSILRNGKSARDAFEAKVGGNGRSSLIDKIGYFFGRESQTWDYCLFSTSLHRRFLRRAKAMDRDMFVVVGHPKSFVGDSGLRYMLRHTYKDFSYQTVRTQFSQIISYL